MRHLRCSPAVQPTWAPRRGAVRLRPADDRAVPPPRRGPPPEDLPLTLGPLPSTAVAQRAIEAIESVVLLRRCRDRAAATPIGSPCAAAQLGVALGPCAGTIDERGYQPAVDAAAAVMHQPSLVVAPLVARMHQLAAAQRYEEAAATHWLTAPRALRRQHLVNCSSSPDGRAGRRSGRCPIGQRHVGGHGAPWTGRWGHALPAAPNAAADPEHAHAESVVIAGWLLRHRSSWRLVESSGPWRLETVADQLASITAPAWSTSSTFVDAGSGSGHRRDDSVDRVAGRVAITSAPSPTTSHTIAGRQRRLECDARRSSGVKPQRLVHPIFGRLQRDVTGGESGDEQRRPTDVEDRIRERQRRRQRGP